jgi:cbb3-type cytochrome oxidase cytochrome c subunit
MDTYQILPKDVNNVAVDPNRKNRRPGPPLLRIATKVSEDWAAKWVLAPRDFRSTTRMPHFFGQSNTRAKVNQNDYPVVEVNGVKRSPVDDTIVASLVKYVWSLSDKEADPAPPALKGDAIKGEIIVKQVGCTACHKLVETPLSVFQDQSPEKPATRSRYLEDFAPTLFGVGSKMNKAWLFAWVRNPKKHFKDSSMPNLRLSEQEATDVVEYLMTLKKPEWEKLAAPQANGKIVDDLIVEILKKVMSDYDAAQTLAGKNPLPEYKEMASADGKVKWLGRKMVKNFGCYSCHQLKDDPDSGMKWQDEEGIGVELSGSQPWGSKHHDKLDFGFAADDGVNHHGVEAVDAFDRPVKAHVAESRAAWLENKLENPRIYDAGKMASKPWDELLRMPNFGLNKMEIELVATFVQSFTDHAVTGLVENSKKRPNAEEMATYRGDRIVRENNCRACHRLSLDSFMIEWARKEKGKEKRTPVFVEGRFGRVEPSDATESSLRKWKDPTDRDKKPLLGEKEDLKKSGKRLETYSWTTDHMSLGVPGITPETSLDKGESTVVNPDSKYIYFDGNDEWYLDVQGGEIKHKRKVLRHSRQDGGEIIAELRKFKRDLSEANAPYNTPAYEKYTDFMDVGNEGEFETRWAPMLRSQGVKTQTEWLFKFLKAPYPIRPTLQPIYPGAKALPDVNLRMPTFDFADEEANAAVRWFAVRDQLKGTDSFPSTEFPERADEFLAARKGAHEKVSTLVKDGNTGCQSCHYIAGNAPPGAVLKHAPDLERVQDRLRPRWMYEWQTGPADIYPGTTMTVYDFKPLFGGNQKDGVRATVEYLLNFGKLNPKK